MMRLLLNRIFVLGLVFTALIGCSTAQIAPEAQANNAVGVDEGVLDSAETPIIAPTAENTVAPLSAESTATDEPPQEPTLEPTPFKSTLPILQEAPNITNETWINSEPLTLEGLRGKVVLIEFWTYG